MVARGVRDRGGVGRYLSTLLAHWPCDGTYALRVIDPYGRGGLVLSPVYLLWACVRVAAGAASGRIELLHIHVCSRGSFLRKGILTHLAALLKVPLILHLHAPDFDEFHRALPAFGRRWVTATFARADRVVVLGRSWRQMLTAQVGVSPKRISILYSATSSRNQSTIKPTGDPQLVFVGQLGVRKGLAELLHALARPEIARLAWTVRVLGDGKLAYWREEVHRLGLAERVVFEGWVAESRVRQVLAESSIFVLPSRAEGLSIALLEAMAFGLAVVTTTAGGAADILVDEESALLVPPGDVDALATAIERVLLNSSLRAAIQAGAWRRFTAAHEITSHCQSVERLYDEVLGARADRRRRT